MSPSLDTLRQDLRFGARTLARNPGFAAIAVLTLAIGIGANAAIFSVVNAVLLRPLPWREPDRAVMIWSKWTAFDKTWVATGEVVDYRRRSRTLEEIAAWGDGQVNLTGDGEPERVSAANVTSNLFSTLGVAPLVGRTFTAAEDLPEGPDLVLLGFGLWNRRYAADPSIVGRTILINGRPFEVVGVMSPGFVLPTDFGNPEPTQLWMPLQMDPASTDHGSHGLYAAGRLKPGATVAQAAQELQSIADAMTGEGLYPRQMQFGTVVLSLTDEVVGTVRRSLLLLFGAVAFLLLIACANVANLLLARAEARQRELAVRSALGAGRLRVLRQLLTENLVLTVISALAGLALAFAGVRLVAWWNPASIPRVSGVTLDLKVLAFTAGVALLTSVLFGLAPALRALRADLTDSLKDRGQNASTGSGRQRFRNALVVVEMALAVVLLVGAGLMLRSLWSLQRVPLGFEPSGVLTMRVALPAASYPQSEQVVGFFQRLVDEIRQLPGVQRAGAARLLPLGSTIGDTGLMVEGYDPPPGTNAKGDWQIVTDGYLEAIGERVIRGRTFTAADTTGSMLVGLINEEMARRYWSGRDPIGGRFRIGGNPNRPWVTVVGIVADVRHNGVTEPIKEKYYVPHTQWHESVGNPIRAMSLVVKTSTDPLTLVGPVRARIRALDPNLPVAQVRTMTDVVGATMSTPRFTGVLLGAFAAMALMLSAVGIYGVLSYLVSRRMREIGIRVAIGAGRGHILSLVLRSGLGLAVAGVAMGLAVAAVAARTMSSLLHEVSPLDPVTFAAVGLGLTLVAAAASFVPAWRATRVDPVMALKTE
ncbi:MAG TPA: ABC transporter permease [Vicinamibacterales bacterium]|nr:ABC transporter permease [Vicinamibacterales bacterium]